MKLKSIILGLFCWAYCAQFVAAQEKYAVIIARDPEFVTILDTTIIPWADRFLEEYWHDTFAAWDDLVQNHGFNHENIFFAFRNDGYNDEDREYYVQTFWNAYNSMKYDWGNPYWPVPNVDNTWSGVTQVFEGLANGSYGYPQVTEDDFLFVMTFTYGDEYYGSDGNMHSAMQLDDGVWLRDYQLAGLVSQIPAHKKVFWINQTDAMWHIDYLSAIENTFIFTATDTTGWWNCDDLNVNGDTIIENEIVNDKKYYHGEISFHLLSSSFGHLPGRDSTYYYGNEPLSAADVNNDSVISFEESADWTLSHYSTDQVPLKSDVYNIGRTTSFSYPTIINEYVNDLNIIRGLACVTPGIKHMYPGTSITIKENAKVDFIDDGWIQIASGATLEIEDNVELNTNSELNKLNVYGTLTLNANFNSNIKIIVEDNGELYLANGAILNTANITIKEGGFIYLADDATFGTNSSLTVNGDVRNYNGSGVRLTINGDFSLGENSLITGLTSHENGGVYIENDRDVTLNNATFGNSDLYVDLNYDNLTISNSTFNASKVDADIYTNQLVGNCVITRNSFYNIEANEAVKIDGFNTFMITDNVFEDNSGTGLAIYNCGQQMYPNHHVTGNIFRNNNGYPYTSYGVYVYQSVVNIGNNNKIYGNGIGLGFCHESNASVYGDERLIERGDFQEIYNNELYQVYAMDNSFPANFIANVIADGGDPNPMIYCTNTSAPRHDVENNCWGEAFNQTTDFYPTHGYDYFPKWNCGYDPSINLQISDAKLMYDESVEKMQDGDYATADGLLKEIVLTYPESPYAASAIKTLPSVAIVEGNGFNDVIGYLQTDPTVTNNENLSKTAGYTVANCHIYAQNYSEALTFYEEIISNPPTYEDSVFAVVDAGRVALLMEENHGKSNHTFKYPKLIPASQAEYKVNRFNLLNTLIQQPVNIQPQEEYVLETEENETEDIEEVIGGVLQKSMLGVENNQETEQVFRIYPNPLNNTATIQYYVVNDGMVNIKLYNTNGKLVETLVNKEEAGGTHQVQVNAANFEAGIYYVVFEDDGRYVKVEKMVVLK